MTVDSSPDSDAANLSRTLVLNALRDVCGGPPVLADDASHELIRRRFEAVVPAERRKRFREAAVADAGSEDAALLAGVAADVLADLTARDTVATFIHRAPLSVPSRAAHLYTFVTTHDPTALTALSLPGAIRTHVERGATTLAKGDPETAAARFEDAVRTAGTGDGAVATRVLAAHAHHLAEDDAAAIDYVEEALHLDTRAWSAKLVGYAADARRPEKFRRGKLGARVYFRWTSDVSDRGSVTVAVGSADGQTVLSGRDECMPIKRLWPDSRVEVRLVGELPDLPVVQSYYVAIGVVDREVNEARSTEQILLSGPAAAAAKETIRFE